MDRVDPPVPRETAEQIGSKIASGTVVPDVASIGKVTPGWLCFKRPAEETTCRPPHQEDRRSCRRNWWRGRPDFAPEGGKDVEKIDHALQAVYNIVAGT